MDGQHTIKLACPGCGKPMHLARIIPGIGGLSELRVYSCRQCGVSLTQAEEPGNRGAGGPPAMPNDVGVRR